MGYAMTRRVRAEPLEVQAKLDSMGLHASDLRSAVEAHFNAANLFSPLAPAFGRGIAAFTGCVESLREEALARRDGWEPFTKDGRAGIASVARKMSVVPMVGDERTGCSATSPTGDPSNRRAKGPGTVGSVDRNRETLRMFDDGDDPVRPVHSIARVGTRTVNLNGFQEWVLLIAVGEEYIRSELSLPVELQGKFITRWLDRILLPAIPIDTDPRERAYDEPTEPDVDVRRRA